MCALNAAQVWERMLPIISDQVAVDGGVINDVAREFGIDLPWERVRELKTKSQLRDLIVEVLAQKEGVKTSEQAG
jgi:hypothetical protein